MATVVLIRHGRSSANTSGVLAGRSPGVHLDEVGQKQAADLGARLRSVPLACVISSPLERTLQTAAALVEARSSELAVHEDDRLIECAYGDWTGQELKALVKEPLWRTVQGHPSAVRFPNGESMVGMQQRAVEAIREWNSRLGPKAVYAVVSHGDVIKAILADALGMHLDQFQRIMVDPASASVVSYTALRPFVQRVNDVSGSFDFLRRQRRRRSSDAVVGGGAGEGSTTTARGRSRG